MLIRRHIILAARSRHALEALAQTLEDEVQYEVELHQIVDDADPLSGVDSMPDVLVLRVTPNAVEELAALARRAPSDRPPLVVIGAAQDPQMMRLAMQCGARDFLSEPLEGRDLLAVLDRVCGESQASKSGSQRTRSVAFVNAKGGAGASFLATNVAHVMTVAHRHETVLVDVDLQFGSLPQYLDLQPKRGLIEALQVVHELDAVAVDAYLTRHGSGLRVLSRCASSPSVNVEDAAARYGLLLEMIRAKAARVVFDVPRHLDALGAMTLERADRIILVMQQTLPSLRDATRLFEIIRDEIGVPQDRLSVLVNRYRKGAPVELEDIRRPLRDADPFLVPNHFGPVAECIDAGVPIYDHARSSPVTRAILELVTQLEGKPVRVQRGFINRTISTILRT